MCVQSRMNDISKGGVKVCVPYRVTTWLWCELPFIEYLVGGTGLWEDVCNRLEQFRYCFVVFEAAGVALGYRPVGLSESTRSSRHFKYSLELYLAL